MFRTSGINSEIVDYLLDRAGKLRLGRPSRRNATETNGARGRALPSDHRFAHAVHELAALSISARFILALRS
jgi:hypothetical protein